VNRAALTLSRAWVLADLGLGRLGGSPCPSCGTAPTEPPAHRWGPLNAFPVWRCQKCGLLYRPTGFTAPGVTSFYYSWMYSNANLATDVGAIDDLQQVRDSMGSRRRAALLRDVAPVEGGGSRPPVVYVLGCSWGYEVWDLQQSGFRAVGVEVSSPRRNLGRQRLNLPLYATLQEAAANEPPPDIVMSSHVLEHVPRVEAYLDDVLATVTPRFHVHMTPNVEPYPADPATHPLIGREHPIGVTRAFWQRYAATRSLDLTTRVDRYRPNEWSGELVAVLKPA